MTKQVIIFSETPSNRLAYAANFIFGQISGLNILHVHTLNGTEQGVILNYSKRHIPHALVSITPFGTLTEGAEINCPDYLNSEDHDFDFFSFTFYHLSRAEEYKNANGDEHGRFTFRNSWAKKNQLGNQPYIDLLLAKKFEQLNSLLGHSQFQLVHSYTPRLTIDVDQTFAYRRKPLHRWLGSLMKDIFTFRFKRVPDRFLSTFRLKKDPYDRVPYMIECAREKNIQSLVFYLAGGETSYDRAIDLREKDIIDSDELTQIGIHPSYDAFEDVDTIKSEKQRLQELTNERIANSRFHYLRFQLPTGYDHLIEAGILHDYTLTWPDAIGFRAGTCFPFQYYHLSEERITDLMIHPCIAMDVILKNQLNLPVTDVANSIKPLITHCKAFGGECNIIWHNSSFDPTEGWSGWSKVFNTILELMQQD